VGFIEVATSRGVTLFAPEQSFVSFFNSPYYAHGNLTGLDIYSDSRNFGSIVPSPISGMVRKLYPFKPFSSRWFKAPEIEYLMLIECRENPDVWIKVLHVDPRVKEGENVAVGDPLGVFIRDGFFHPWTDPHTHIEARSPTDPIRASGGYLLTPKGLRNEPIPYGSKKNDSVLKATIVKASDRYALVDLQDAFFVCVGPFYGVQAESDGAIGLLDGGVPHYQRAGIFGFEDRHLNSPSSIRVWGVNIGKVYGTISKGISLLQCDTFMVTLGGIRCTGLSCYLGLKRHHSVKALLPEGTSFKAGEATTLSIQPCEEPFEDVLHRAFHKLVEGGPWGASLLTNKRTHLKL
jgi:hypothetical protein